MDIRGVGPYGFVAGRCQLDSRHVPGPLVLVCEAVSNVDASIRQGCPLSGTLFALAVYLLVHGTLPSTALRSARFCSWATLRHLLEELRALLRLLGVRTRASGMRLNESKRVVLPRPSRTLRRLQEPSLSGSLLKRSRRCVGQVPRCGGRRGRGRCTVGGGPPQRCAPRARRVRGDPQPRRKGAPTQHTS